MELSGFRSLALAALIVGGITSCGGSNGPLIPPVPTGSATQSYTTTAALGYAIGCTDVKPAGKALFPGSAKEVATCVLNKSRVLLAIYPNTADREAASTLEANQLSGTAPEDAGIVDDANWIVSGHNSVLSTVVFRTKGHQERPQ